MSDLITTAARTAMEGHGLTDAVTVLDENGRAAAYSVLCPATGRYSVVTLAGEWIIPGAEGYRTRGPVTGYIRKNLSELRPDTLRVLEPARHTGRVYRSEYGRRSRMVCGGRVTLNSHGSGYQCSSCRTSLWGDDVIRTGFVLTSDFSGTHTVSYALDRSHGGQFGVVGTAPVVEPAPVVVEDVQADAPADVAGTLFEVEDIPAAADPVVPVPAVVPTAEVPATAPAVTAADRSWWIGRYCQWVTDSVPSDIPGAVLRMARAAVAAGWAVVVRAGTDAVDDDTSVGVWEVEATGRCHDNAAGGQADAVLSMMWTETAAGRWLFNVARSVAELGGRILDGVQSRADYEKAIRVARVQQPAPAVEVEPVAVEDVEDVAPQDIVLDGMGWCRVAHCACPVDGIHTCDPVALVALADGTSWCAPCASDRVSGWAGEPVGGVLGGVTVDAVEPVAEVVDGGAWGVGVRLAGTVRLTPVLRGDGLAVRGMASVTESGVTDALLTLGYELAEPWSARRSTIVTTSGGNRSASLVRVRLVEPVADMAVVEAVDVDPVVSPVGDTTDAPAAAVAAPLWLPQERAYTLDMERVTVSHMSDPDTVVACGSKREIPAADLRRESDLPPVEREELGKGWVRWTYEGTTYTVVDLPNSTAPGHRNVNLSYAVLGRDGELVSRDITWPDADDIRWIHAHPGQIVRNALSYINIHIGLPTEPRAPRVTWVELSEAESAYIAAGPKAPEPTAAERAATAAAKAVKVGDIVFVGTTGAERAELLGHAYSVTTLAGVYGVRHLASGDLIHEGAGRPGMKRAILADALERGAVAEPAPVAASPAAPAHAPAAEPAAVPVSGFAERLTREQIRDTGRWVVFIAAVSGRGISELCQVQADPEGGWIATGYSNAEGWGRTWQAAAEQYATCEKVWREDQRARRAAAEAADQAAPAAAAPATSVAGAGPAPASAAGVPVTPVADAKGGATPRVGDIRFVGKRGDERAALLGHSYSVTLDGGTYTVVHEGTGTTVVDKVVNRPAAKRAILLDAVERGAVAGAGSAPAAPAPAARPLPKGVKVEGRGPRWAVLCSHHAGAAWVTITSEPADRAAAVEAAWRHVEGAPHQHKTAGTRTWGVVAESVAKIEARRPARVPVSWEAMRQIGDDTMRVLDVLVVGANEGGDCDLCGRGFGFLVEVECEGIPYQADRWCLSRYTDVVDQCGPEFESLACSYEGRTWSEMVDAGGAVRREQRAWARLERLAYVAWWCGQVEAADQGGELGDGERTAYVVDANGGYATDVTLAYGHTYQVKERTVKGEAVWTVSHLASGEDVARGTDAAAVRAAMRADQERRILAEVAAHQAPADTAEISGHGPAGEGVPENPVAVEAAEPVQESPEGDRAGAPRTQAEALGLADGEEFHGYRGRYDGDYDVVAANGHRYVFRLPNDARKRISVRHVPDIGRCTDTVAVASVDTYAEILPAIRKHAAKTADQRDPMTGELTREELVMLGRFESGRMFRSRGDWYETNKGGRGNGPALYEGACVSLVALGLAALGDADDQGRRTAELTEGGRSRMPEALAHMEGIRSSLRASGHLAAGPDTAAVEADDQDGQDDDAAENVEGGEHAPHRGDYCLLYVEVKDADSLVIQRRLGCPVGRSSLIAPGAGKALTGPIERVSVAGAVALADRNDYDVAGPWRTSGPLSRTAPVVWRKAAEGAAPHADAPADTDKNEGGNSPAGGRRFSAADVVTGLGWSQRMVDVVAMASSGELHADGEGRWIHWTGQVGRKGRAVKASRVRMLLDAGFIAPDADGRGAEVIGATADGREALRLVAVHPDGVHADDQAAERARLARVSGRGVRKDEARARAAKLPPLPGGDEARRRAQASREWRAEQDALAAVRRAEAEAIRARAEAEAEAEQVAAKAKRAKDERRAAEGCGSCGGVWPVEARCGACRDAAAAGTVRVDVDQDQAEGVADTNENPGTVQPAGGRQENRAAGAGDLRSEREPQAPTRGLLSLPPYVRAVQLDLAGYRWGVECDRHGGAPWLVPGVHADREDAEGAARMHAMDHPTLRTPLTPEEIEAAQALALSDMQLDVLSWAQRGDLTEDTTGFYVPDGGKGAPRTFKARRVLTLWAAGLLDVDLDERPRRSVRLSDQGRAAWTLWDRARRQDVVQVADADNEFGTTGRDRAGYQTLKAEAAAAAAEPVVSAQENAAGVSPAGVQESGASAARGTESGTGPQRVSVRERLRAEIDAQPAAVPGVMARLLAEHVGPDWRPIAATADPVLHDDDQQETEPVRVAGPLTRQQRRAAWRLASGEAAPVVVEAAAATMPTPGDAVLVGGRAATVRSVDGIGTPRTVRVAWSDGAGTAVVPWTELDPADGVEAGPVAAGIVAGRVAAADVGRPGVVTVTVPDVEVGQADLVDAVVGEADQDQQDDGQGHAPQDGGSWWAWAARAAGTVADAAAAAAAAIGDAAAAVARTVAGAVVSGARAARPVAVAVGTAAVRGVLDILADRVTGATEGPKRRAVAGRRRPGGRAAVSRGVAGRPGQGAPWSMAGTGWEAVAVAAAWAGALAMMSAQDRQAGARR
ncbi:hypothetical protein AB0G95_21845 [Streptomyces virginiae]|uniref:hypothetical protein n=1 Tax=Streptomyces virginiae TaxID=1961 RepID=UPI00342A45A8